MLNLAVEELRILDVLCACADRESWDVRLRCPHSYLLVLVAGADERLCCVASPTLRYLHERAPGSSIALRRGSHEQASTRDGCKRVTLPLMVGMRWCVVSRASCGQGNTAVKLGGNVLSAIASLRNISTATIRSSCRLLL
jgi:hypothetical protein